MAYEKAIKAYALMRWTGPSDDAELRSFFLREHSPLTKLEGAPKPSRKLDVLKRELKVFMRKLPDSASLTKIDETIPRLSPEHISYRYPFLVSDEYVAPASYPGWDVYQGEERACLKAVEQLLKAVGDELKAFERKPK